MPLSISATDGLVNRVVFDGGTGDVSWSLDFGIPLTGADSNVPGWDTFDPLTRIFTVDAGHFRLYSQSPCTVCFI